MIKSVIAHDPAIEWMSDDARKSLLPDDVWRVFPANLQGPGGYGSMDDAKDDDDSTRRLPS
jgi:hypothetical protein